MPGVPEHNRSAFSCRHFSPSPPPPAVAFTVKCELTCSHWWVVFSEHVLPHSGCVWDKTSTPEAPWRSRTLGFCHWDMKVWTWLSKKKKKKKESNVTKHKFSMALLWICRDFHGKCYFSHLKTLVHWASSAHFYVWRFYIWGGIGNEYDLFQFGISPKVILPASELCW